MSREPPLFIHYSSVHSLAGNHICYFGVEGLKALIAAIEKMPNLTSLKCASSKVCPGLPRAIG